MLEACRNLHLHNPFATWEERWFFPIIVGVGAFAISLFLYFPPLWLWPDGVISERFEEYWRLSQDLFARDIPTTFLGFRLVYPFLGKVLFLSKPLMLALPPLFAVATLSVVYIAMTRVATAPIALFITLLTALNGGFQFSNARWGIPDSITYLSIAVSLLTKHPLLIFISTLIGGMNDDRLVLALPFVYLWHFNSDHRQSVSWLGGVAAGLLILAVVHYSLSTGLIGPGIQEANEYNKLASSIMNLRFSPYDNDWRGWVFNVIGTFRVAWLLPFLAIIVLTKNRQYINTFLYFLFCVGIIFLSLFVGDTSRNIAFAFPMLLVAVADLARKAAPSFTNQAVIWILLACVAMPGYMYGGQNDQFILIYYPLPLVLVRTFLWTTG